MGDEPPIETRVGEPFSITLTTNPSTGYSWEIDAPIDRLEILEREYVHSSHLIGAGGQETIRFRARSVGEATIVCRYRRPWEQAAGEERRFTVRVRP